VAQPVEEVLPAAERVAVADLELAVDEAHLERAARDLVHLDARAARVVVVRDDVDPAADEADPQGADLVELDDLGAGDDPGLRGHEQFLSRYISFESHVISRLGSAQEHEASTR